VSRTFGYAAACCALGLGGTAACWPLLEAPGRMGVLAAAVLAVPVQVGTFAALAWSWERRGRFLAAWIGGTAVRLIALAAAVVAVAVSTLPPASTLLGVAAFFFAMLLIEPFFLGREGPGTPAGRRAAER
jgi:hypothetical protein